MGDVVVLALLASFNPTLLTATTVMLLLDRPAKLMAGYLAGALITSMTLGCLIVFSLDNSSVTDTTQHTVNPLTSVGLGVLALIAAYFLGSDRPRRKPKPAGKAPPRWQRELSKGSARTTFVIGMLLTLPGASYLAGLNRIDKLGYSNSATVLAILGFNLIMMWLLELPLVAYLVAPDWTDRTIARAKAWFFPRARGLAVKGLTIIGTLLIAKGVVGLIA